jgi:repressor LexA
MRRHIAPGTRLPLRISRRERDLVLERTFIDSELEGRLRAARPSAGRLVVDLTLDDIDELAGYLAAEVNHSNDAGLCRVFDRLLTQLNELEDQHTDTPPPAATPTAARKPFTAKQGQYLAFIYYYTKIHRRPPAEADFARFFRVSPPAVHDMILMLERSGLVERTPGMARSLRLTLLRADLPDLA